MRKPEQDIVIEEESELEGNDEIISSEKFIVDDPTYCVSSCTGFCCREYTVLCTPLDVRRILDNLPSHVTDFVAFYQGDIETQNYYPKVLLGGEEYCLGLLTSPKTGGCVFQTGLGICGIHTFSPMVCQTYPWNLDHDGELTYMDNVLCHELYPAGNPESTKATIRQSWKEIEITKKMITEWNEQFGNDPDKDTTEFLQFVNCWTE